MSDHRVLNRLFLACCAAALTGCILPDPVTHAVLRVSPIGGYELDGVAVSAALLAGAVSAKRVAARSLVLEVRASPEAGIDAIRLAVRAAAHAQARIAFARDAPPAR
jgi:hypothetical protein